MNDETWPEAVIDAIGRLVGPDQAATVAAAWDEHAAREKVEVTFLGPYSSGKSTLLRRLIVDGDAEVPDWLTVSARRETFELNAVDVGDLTFTDAPGFAAGNELHDELAEDALALSDAFLLVVPPQLLTSARERVASIVSGRHFFGEHRAGGEPTVIAVVAQADTMGVDPEDDVDGLRLLAERKRKELIGQLQDAAGVALPGLQVHCVAADPYEEQARHPQPSSSAFDPYRTWDGIDALTAALHALPARRDELRRWAGIRYLQRVGGSIASQAEAVVGGLEESAKDLRARHDEWEHQKARTDAVVADAQADLHTTLVSFASEAEADVEGGGVRARGEVEDRLATTIDRWRDRWDAELALVLGEAEVQAGERLGRPRAQRTQEFLRSVSAEAVVGTDGTGSPVGNSRVFSMLTDANQVLQGRARKTLELYAGEPIEKLLARAQKLKDGGAAARSSKAVAKQSAAKSAGKKAATGTGKQVGKKAGAEAGEKAAEQAGDKLLRSARTFTAALEIIDGVVAVASIFETERQQRVADTDRRRAREARAKRNDELAASLSREIVDGSAAVPGWRAQADEALDRVREQLGVGDAAAVDELLAEVTAQQRSIADLRGLLAEGSA